MTLSAELKNLAAVRYFVKQRTADLGACQRDIEDLVLAVDEATTNIMLHGYRGEAGTIEIELQREGEFLLVRLSDKAPPFDPAGVPPPDLTIPIDQRPFGGMGIHLMREMVDEIHHRPRSQGGNELTLVKRICSETNFQEGQNEDQH
jgi:serine/threonine-protein kinase RsbW